MNISNLNKTQLLDIGLSSVMNVTDGRIGFYSHQVIPLGGIFSISELREVMSLIDDHDEMIDLSFS